MHALMNEMNCERTYGMDIIRPLSKFGMKSLCESVCTSL